MFWMIVYSLENIVEYRLHIVEYMTKCWKVAHIVDTKELIGKKQMEKSYMYILWYNM